MTYNWLSPSERYERLRRCSKADREDMLAFIDTLDRAQTEAAASARRWAREANDLRVIVKDQRNHIANLEAELLPHLKAQPEFEQEALA